MQWPVGFRVFASGFSLCQIASLAICVALLGKGLSVSADEIQRVEANAASGAASAVVATDGSLLHTTQIFPAAADLSASAVEQFGSVISQLKSLTSKAQAAEIIKLNIYATSEATAADVLKALPTHFAPGHEPAVAIVVSSLPVERAFVAADAVAYLSDREVKTVTPSSDAMMLPSGSRIYISGQAHQSESLAEATAGTLQSLHKTLEFLGRSDADIVQLKAFVEPMADHATVTSEVAKFFEGKIVPPLVLVEWKSSKTVPVEIELIAAGGTAQPNAPKMEFLTPPEMTASPVYCRICRVNSPSLIYVSGLYSQHDVAAHPQRDANGDVEVRSVFESLDRILKQTNSDFRHLAKATYYVATDAASSSLNKLRPNYYDPLRPPAASKATVSSVGLPELGLTLDMIAVPVAP